MPEKVKEGLRILAKSLTLEGAKAKAFETTVTFVSPDGLACTIFMDVEAVFDTKRVTKDEEGNEYLPLKVKVTISPSQSLERDPLGAIAQLQFELKVAQLAQSIVERFEGRELRGLFCTAKERAEQNVWEVVEPHVKGRRIGQIKWLRKPEGLVNGKYTYEKDGKCYSVNVEVATISLVRTS